MKKFFLLLFSSIILTNNIETNEESKIVKKENLEKIAKYINDKKTTWKAHVPNRDYSVLLGVKPELINLAKEKRPEAFDKRIRNPSPFFNSLIDVLPENYDLREAHPECIEIIGNIPDQANCGSCWAVAATSVMSDRICLKSGAKIKKFVSALDLLSCCPHCYGCNGGLSFFAFDYWVEGGIVSGGKYNDTTTCKPYFLKPCDHHMKVEIYGDCGNSTSNPHCDQECQKNYDVPYNKDKNYGEVSYNVWGGEEEIMKEIYVNGSVSASFNVYEDFYTYESGIYKYETGNYQGGHEVRIIGWGVENGVKYWTVVNSWNENWGEKGTFRILRGEDECKIESLVSAGEPKI